MRLGALVLWFIPCVRIYSYRPPPLSMRNPTVSQDLKSPNGKRLSSWFLPKAAADGENIEPAQATSLSGEQVSTSTPDLATWAFTPWARSNAEALR